MAGIDRAVVNDAAVARAGKSKLTAAFAAQKIGVGNIQRARHQSADIHLGARAKGDAVRVDQKDLAIRQKLAKDRGGIAAQHAIQRKRRWLQKSHALVRRDIEIRPVQNQRVRLLIDRGGRPVDLHIALTLNDLPALNRQYWCGTPRRHA